jgi:hypothetical protein
VKIIVTIIALFSLALSNLSETSAANVEEALDQLNRRPAAERQAILEREARKEGRIIFHTTLNVADLQDLKRIFAKISFSQDRILSPWPRALSKQDSDRSLGWQLGSRRDLHAGALPG